MSLLSSLTKLTSRRDKRLGRGYGSGVGGHTVGRGAKGMRARKSGEAPLWFEGGQLPLVKRLPMQRGKGRFNVLEPTALLRLSDIEGMKGDTVTLDSVKLAGLIDKRFKKAKIVANGKVTRAITVKGIATSAAARKQIEAAGGSVA